MRGNVAEEVARVMGVSPAVSPSSDLPAGGFLPISVMNNFLPASRPRRSAGRRFGSADRRIVEDLTDRLGRSPRRSGPDHLLLHVGSPRAESYRALVSLLSALAGTSTARLGRLGYGGEHSSLDD
jgi:hypothetical protein